MITPLTTSRTRSGFTLIELMMVVVIMGIISTTVLPAMGNVRAMREGAARDDLMRFIEVTKGRAVASGMPHGLQINLSDSSLTIVRITDAGTVEVEPDPLTNRDRAINLSSLYSGVTLTDMINGNGAGGSGTIWFDYESNPHTRSSSGVFLSLNSSIVTVAVSSGEFVVVHPYSGVLEVQY